MRQTGADRRMWAAVIAALAAMALCFALRGAAAEAPPPPPWAPPRGAPNRGLGLLVINTPARVALNALPGIGEVRAQAILDDRAANGPYRYPEDLIRVRGIGEGILEDILDQITTGGQGYAQNIGS